MSETDNEPRVPKPESLEAKFKLLALLPYDERVRRKHSLVYGFILDWYHSKYGDALASVRHVAGKLKERDPAGRGLGLPHVHGALSDLVEWGYLEQEKGSGKRASRYVPAWAHLNSSVTPVGNTKDVDPSVTPVGNTTVTPVGNTNPPSVTPVPNEDPSTRTRLQDRVTGIDGQECAAPTAPPAAAADAPRGTGPAQDGFEELWQAYDYKKKKREAKAAYAKLAPDADLHSAMVEAARKWQSSWAAQNKPDAPRFHLHKWIEREEYECDPPTAYKPKERKQPRQADRDDAPAARGKLTEPLRIIGAEPIGSPFGDYRVRLVLDGKGGDQEHILKVFDENGPGADHLIYGKMQRVLSGDIEEWHGERVRLEISEDSIVDAVREAPPDRTVEIFHTELKSSNGEQLIVCKLCDADSKPEGRLEFVWESRDEYLQEQGQKRLSSLCHAVGVGELEDTKALEMIPFVLTSNGQFRPLSANDNTAGKEAA